MNFLKTTMLTFALAIGMAVLATPAHAQHCSAARREIGDSRSIDISEFLNDPRAHVAASLSPRAASSITSTGFLAIRRNIARNCACVKLVDMRRAAYLIMARGVESLT